MNASSINVAWEGWSLRAPGDWRPLKLEGDRRRGSMMLGDADNAALLVKWWRPGESASFDARRWMVERFEALGAEPDDGAPHPAGFAGVGWIVGLEKREGERKTVWCGCSAENVVIECVLSGLVPQPLQHAALHVIPTLRVSPEDGETAWAMYALSFLSPPGYRLRRRHLFTGDVALEFANAHRETLLLRQVYPAGLALRRRSPERWLDCSPFLDRRRFVRGRKPAPDHERSLPLDGIRRSGERRYPAPFGFCAPRHCEALAVQDARADRLLIAESQTIAHDDGRLAAEGVLNMNRMPAWATAACLRGTAHEAVEGKA